jgi:hypothetical protein
MGSMGKARPARRRKHRTRRPAPEPLIAVPHTVRCDGCGASFKVAPEMRRLPDEGEIHFFRCPACERVYVMARITARGVALRRTLAAIQDRIKRTNGEVRARLLRQAAQIRWELEPEVSGSEG